MECYMMNSRAGAVLPDWRRLPSEDRLGAAIGAAASVPLDLAEWFSRLTLAEWIREETGRLVWDGPQSASADPRENGVGPGILLSVLALGYVTRNFESESISMACREDEIYRGLCGGTIPFARDLIRFRRSNHGLLVTVLSRVFARAVRERSRSIAVPLSPAWRQSLHEQAVERLDIARHMDRGD
jgi:hypothetical protein